jgi:hypothetical protein
MIHTSPDRKQKIILNKSLNKSKKKWKCSIESQL